MVIMFFELLQSLRVKDPGGAARQCAAEKLRKQIVLKTEYGAALRKPVLQRGGSLKPCVIRVVQVGKGRRNAAFSYR